MDVKSPGAPAPGLFRLLLLPLPSADMKTEPPWPRDNYLILLAPRTGFEAIPPSVLAAKVEGSGPRAARAGGADPEVARSSSTRTVAARASAYGMANGGSAKAGRPRPEDAAEHAGHLADAHWRGLPGALADRRRRAGLSPRGQPLKRKYRPGAEPRPEPGPPAS
jgi:diadenosine tetraphosphatase ApaH/serine/threonine PP2A family protein phosphatase